MTCQLQSVKFPGAEASFLEEILEHVAVVPRGSEEPQGGWLSPPGGSRFLFRVTCHIPP